MHSFQSSKGNTFSNSENPLRIGNSRAASLVGVEWGRVGGWGDGGLVVKRLRRVVLDSERQSCLSFTFGGTFLYKRNYFN